MNQILDQRKSTFLVRGVETFKKFFFVFTCFTGFGGGFKENAKIEYNERDDSDGEYDEVTFISLSTFSIQKK